MAYEFDTRAAAVAATVPATGDALRLSGYWAAGDGGETLYRRLGAAPSPVKPWHLKTADNAWWQIAENTINVRQLGAKGDGTTDDTTACQAAIDAAKALAKILFVPTGSYLTGPLKLNGSDWDGSTTNQQPSIKGIKGEARGYFVSRFVAKAGAYTAGQAVLTLRNAASVSVQGLHVDGANIADVGCDFAWLGAGPSLENVFRDLFVENCNSTGLNLDNAGDTIISGIWYRGGSAPVGLSMQLPGGGIWADNVILGTGKLLLSCQNAGLQNCGFFQGVELTSPSYHNIHFDACHIYPNPVTGNAVCANTAGFSTRVATFTGCFFTPAAANQPAFAGRWHQGAIFNGCQINATTFFDDNFEPGGGSAFPPVFQFNHCSFASVAPASIPGKVLVAFNVQRRADGVIDPAIRAAGDIRGGNLYAGDGQIAAGKLQVTSGGLFGRDMNGGTAPADAYFGMMWNRSGGAAETELMYRGVVWRLTSWDGSAYTPRLNFSYGAGSGLYAEADNVQNLGIASRRWATVYAGTGAINTSDARSKTPVAPLMPAEIAAAKALAGEIGTYRLLDAVQAKGEGARSHVGLTVQRAIEILRAQGLDPMRYGFICHDRWEAENDQDGSAGKPAGDIYSFRHDELLLFITRGFEARLAALEAA